MDKGTAACRGINAGIRRARWLPLLLLRLVVLPMLVPSPRDGVSRCGEPRAGPPDPRPSLTVRYQPRSPLIRLSILFLPGQSPFSLTPGSFSTTSLSPSGLALRPPALAFTEEADRESSSLFKQSTVDGIPRRHRGGSDGRGAARRRSTRGTAGENHRTLWTESPR